MNEVPFETILCVIDCNDFKWIKKSKHEKRRKNLFLI